MQFYYSCIDTAIPNYTRCLTIKQWYQEYKKVYFKNYRLSEYEFIFEFEMWHYRNLLFRFAR